jgi:hypothetical protein
MRSSFVLVLIFVVRLAWVLAAIAGAAAYFGSAAPVALHIGLGALVALALLLLALGSHATPRTMSRLAVAVALLLPAAGLLQEGMLATSLPRVLPVIHLLLALAAIALAEMLAARLRRANAQR